MKRRVAAQKNSPAGKRGSSAADREPMDSISVGAGEEPSNLGAGTGEHPAGTSRSGGPERPLQFSARSEFLKVLHRRVEEYFVKSGRHARDCPSMYVKTGVILVWLAASYVSLILAVSTPWLAVLLAISLGLAMAAVGFNIQHDGNHRAYSDRTWVNRMMALTLDMLGGSSYVWSRKHNSIHHTYTNIPGHDDDIDLGHLARLAPGQKHFGFHRLQHFYLWALYGFTAFKWQVFDDFFNVFVGRIGRHHLVRPKGWDLFVFVVGKLFFLSFAFVIPIALCGLLPVIVFYSVATFVQGVVLSVVFQLAHCVENAEFPQPQPGSYVIENYWAVHQIETTVDFALENKVVAWYVGGLNFQVEHHLFPKICHIHYPEISKIVERTCGEFGIQYRVHQTFSAGVASHFNWLRRMGRPEAA